MTYAGLGPDPNLHISTLTWILQKMNRYSATKESSTPPPCATPGGFTRCIHATLAISPLPVRSWPSYNGIAKMLGLPGYVAITTSHDHKRAYNDRSSIDIGGALRHESIHDASKESVRSQIKFMVIIKP